MNVYAHIWLCVCACLSGVCVWVSSSWARVLSFTWMWFMWSVSNLLPQVLFVHTHCARCECAVCVRLRVCVCVRNAFIVELPRGSLRSLPTLRSDVVLFPLVVAVSRCQVTQTNESTTKIKGRGKAKWKAMTTMQGGMWGCNCCSFLQVAKPFVGHRVLSDWIVNSPYQLASSSALAPALVQPSGLPYLVGACASPSPTHLQSRRSYGPLLAFRCQNVPGMAKRATTAHSPIPLLFAPLPCPSWQVELALQGGMLNKVMKLQCVRCVLQL